ncbi:DUF5955 family protein [Amycolatopsis nigrescens]|uniref:DUF5955 family protein n=1 Tax=Amycolatopsis nigrescens TaxID=381445 RepID=UPI00036B37B3|nr:DUF5955 family protein [Amycolatopsis nigrescens]
MNEYNGNTFHGDVRITGDNSPIVGGSHNAVGANPAVHHVSPEPADVSQQLAELLRLITEHEQRLDDPEAARSCAAALSEETAKVKPDHGLLRTLMFGMTAAAGSVGAVAESVAKLRQTFGF